MMNFSLQRKPHAALDLVGRKSKAEKIRRLLESAGSLQVPFSLLEIGTGSGAIAHYFATRFDFQSRVAAVDVIDQRIVSEGFDFSIVTGTVLPFADQSFDIVISNHVIEHVGAAAEQTVHLKEIARVLRADGVAYLATPNRWQVIEPHFHLAFLSWLPRRLRSPYVRFAGKGSHYDCEPLRMRELENLLQVAGLAYRNACILALRTMVSLETSRPALARISSWLPDAILEKMRRWSPTHVYLLRHRDVATC